jgi:dihydroorotate dehydrogenase
VIASGGIMNEETATARMAAGAALVQIYTGFVYRGPALIREICPPILSGSKRPD